MILKKCSSEIHEARKKRRHGNVRPATDLAEPAGTKARSTLPELPNTTFMVMIHRVLNGKDMVQAPKQLQAMYNDVSHWVELVDFIDKNGCPTESCIPR
jgi:hypothetical protein